MSEDRDLAAEVDDLRERLEALEARIGEDDALREREVELMRADIDSEGFTGPRAGS